MISTVGLLTGKKILLIEDDDHSAKLTTVILENAGGTVYRAATTDEAKIFLGEQFPNVILLDLNLPGEGGMEFLRYGQTQKWPRKIPIVVTSVEDNEEVIINAITAGANSYIVKPIKSWELLKVIKQVLFQTKDDKKFRMLDEPLPLEVGVDGVILRINTKGCIIESPFKAIRYGGIVKIQGVALKDVKKDLIVAEIDDISIMSSKASNVYLTRLKFQGLSEDQQDKIFSKTRGWGDDKNA